MNDNVDVGCMFKGFICLMRDLGTLPNTIGSMTTLQSLGLSSNKLSGITIILGIYDVEHLVINMI